MPVFTPVEIIITTVVSLSAYRTDESRSLTEIGTAVGVNRISEPNSCISDVEHRQ
jgi:hypothetical protein